MGETVRTGALLGSAVVAADFDHDGYDDLVIGAPGEQVGFAAGAGRVYVLEGGPGGLSFRVAWSQSARRRRGRGGRPVWCGPRRRKLERRRRAVHGPRGRVPGRGRRGRRGLHVPRLEPPVPLGGRLLHRRGLQLSSLIPGAQIGAALAAGNFVSTTHDDLAIGAPGLHIGTNDLAGAVYLVRGTSAGLALERLSPLRRGRRRRDDASRGGSASPWRAGSSAAAAMTRSRSASRATTIPGTT